MIDAREPDHKGMARGATTGYSFRAMLRLFTAGLSLLLAGCTPPIEAPTELHEVTAWLFARFETDQAGVLEAGVSNLEQALLELDLALPAADRAVSLVPLTEEHVSGLERPDRSLDGLVSVALPFDTAFGPEEHAELVILADQAPVEPDSPDTYDREFLAPTDPSCFPDRDCRLLRTWNAITKESAVMSIPYETGRDFRWVEIGETGSGRWALLDRSWMEQEAPGAQDQTALYQVFSLSAALPTDDGAVRYAALWTESYVLGVDDTIIANAAADSLEATFEAVEQHLQGGR